jgi:hypothetical protein
MAVSGLDSVFSELNKAIGELEEVTQDGLIEAGLQIQASAQKRLRPSVVTGNLRASAYTRSDEGFVRLDSGGLIPEQCNPDPTTAIKGVEVGFTAIYAVYAHENIEGNRAPKFLEGAVAENKSAILEIIRRRAAAR